MNALSRTANDAGTEVRRVESPLVDCYETETAYLVDANLPGVTEEGLDVTLEGDVLTIRGKTCLAEPGNLPLHHAEFLPADYERSFRVTEAIDPDGITATLSNGVLHLELLKRRPSVRRIPVSTPGRVLENEPKE